MENYKNIINEDTRFILLIDGMVAAIENPFIDWQDERTAGDSVEFYTHLKHPSSIKSFFFDPAMECLGAKLGNEKHGKHGYIYFRCDIDYGMVKSYNTVFVSTTLSVNGFSAELRQIL
jgi:hypothetical protein